ncbi:hypothetical protein THF1D04_30158 [Vibrio owensii]|uniref:Uncharacterized protein n=1 Tax=Vibrio owensii TaxID=696485 RepID=A0AAU9Q689_9VIBR|nr:hypothetical protein THF1D04_30158 [Vibrio owensii]
MHLQTDGFCAPASIIKITTSPTAMGILKILGRIRQIKVLQSLLVRTFGYGNFFHAISKKYTLM